jgi:hypothetical protein
LSHETGLGYSLLQGKHIVRISSFQMLQLRFVRVWNALDAA